MPSPGGSGRLLSCPFPLRLRDDDAPGARTEKELLFVDQLDESTDVLIATDDGTLGQRGFVTELMNHISLATYDRIAVCGPEPMMRAVLAKIDSLGVASRTEFSLHRYMKCGVGICGSCCIDPDGLRVCRDGPSFPAIF